MHLSVCISLIILRFYHHTATDSPTNDHEIIVPTTSDRNNIITEKNNTITITKSQSETVCESCRVTAVTVGVVIAVVTALLVVIISVAVHIAVYQCFYKPRLMRSSPVVQGGSGQTDDVTTAGGGGGEAIVYNVVKEREGTVLEMRQNEAYGLVKPN